MSGRPMEKFWLVVLNLSLPFKVLLWVLDLLAKVTDLLADRLDDAIDEWRRAVRVRAGYTPDGRRKSA